jgi:UDP-N-acetylmuramyl pentapeptide synthase
MLTLAEVWLGITRQTIQDSQTPQLSFHDVVIDSRLATPQSLFVALRGEKDDGHRYVNRRWRRELLPPS